MGEQLCRAGKVEGQGLQEHSSKRAACMTWCGDRGLHNHINRATELPAQAAKLTVQPRLRVIWQMFARVHHLRGLDMQQDHTEQSRLGERL